MTENPFALFEVWLGDAKASGLREPTAMTLSTSGAGNQPSARIVLLKDFDENGFVFYTNAMSHKGRDLMVNAKASLLFYWMELQRQIRISGVVEQVGEAAADAYFATRRRESQLGAWASQQSEILASREVLMERMDHYRRKFEGQNVPRPPHWVGYRVAPHVIEFWEEGEFRLHQRTQFTKEHSGWSSALLNP